MSLHLLGIQDKNFDPGEVKPIYLHESSIYIALSISDREVKELLKNSLILGMKQTVMHQ